MRNLPLSRDQGEWLVDLLESCDPSVTGSWRHDLAAEIRVIFGMAPFVVETAIKAGHEVQRFSHAMADAARANPGVRGTGPFGLDLAAESGREYVSCSFPTSADKEGYSFVMEGEWLQRVGPNDYRVVKIRAPSGNRPTRP